MGIFGPDVQKMRTKRDVEGLTKALGHRKAGVRADAAQALGELGDARASEALVAALADDDDDVSRRVATALERLRETSSTASRSTSDSERAAYRLVMDEEVVRDNRSTSDNWIVNATDMSITVACHQPQAGKFSVNLAPGQRGRVAPRIEAQPYPAGNQKYDHFQYQLGLSETWEVRLDSGQLVMQMAGTPAREAPLEKADVNHQEGQLEETVDWAAQRALVDKARAYQKEGQFEQAVECLEQVIESGQDSSGRAQHLKLDCLVGLAQHLKGECLVELGRHEEAAACLKAALVMDPDDDFARYDLGRVLYGLGRRQTARAVFERVARHSGNSLLEEKAREWLEKMDREG